MEKSFKDTFINVNFQLTYMARLPSKRVSFLKRSPVSAALFSINPRTASRPQLENFVRVLSRSKSLSRVGVNNLIFAKERLKRLRAKDKK